MRGLAFLAGFCLVVGGAFAPANAHAERFTGNMLLQRCQSNIAAEEGACLGFVTGVADTIESYQKARAESGEAPSVCMRQGVTIGQLREVVQKYLEANPADRDAPASWHIIIAVAAAYPCPKVAQ